MTEDMYRIMGRITTLKQRFGLIRKSDPASVPVKSRETERQFSRHVDRALGAGANDRDSINRIVERYADEKRLPAELVKSVIEVESGYNPRAISNKGARGLMQLMPSVISDMKVDDPFSAEENIRAGSSLLRELLDRYNGDYKKALAAYNAGRVPVDRANGVPDYPETQNYVKKVIQLYMKNQ